MYTCNEADRIVPNLVNQTIKTSNQFIWKIFVHIFYRYINNYQKALLYTECTLRDTGQWIDTSLSGLMWYMYLWLDNKHVHVYLTDI